MARRPHHQGQGLATDSDFERLLGRELVVDAGAGIAAVAEHSRAVGASVLH
jgi:hypothetical protein